MQARHLRTARAAGAARAAIAAGDQDDAGPFCSAWRGLVPGRSAASAAEARAAGGRPPPPAPAPAALRGVAPTRRPAPRGLVPAGRRRGGWSASRCSPVCRSCSRAEGVEVRLLTPALGAARAARRQAAPGRPRAGVRSLGLVGAGVGAGVEAGVGVGASPSKTSSPKTEPGPSSRGGGAPPTTSMPRAGDTQRRRLPCTTTLSPLPWPPSRATTE